MRALVSAIYPVNSLFNADAFANLRFAYLRIGTSDCPFSIRAGHGQRIRLTLAAFVGQSRTEDPGDEDPASTLAGSRTPRPGLCYEVGTVTVADGASRPPGDSQPLTACGLPTDRASSGPSVLYQAETSNITVQLHPVSVLQRIAPFVIQYEGTYVFFHSILRWSVAVSTMRRQSL